MQNPEVEAASNEPAPRLLSIREVCARLSVSRSWLWRKVATGEFPRPIKLSANRTAWPEAEVSEFIRAAIRKGRAA